MRIKYRITFGYALIVTIILLALFSSIYFYTVNDREKQFRARILNKAFSTSQFLKTKGVTNDIIYSFNRNSHSSLSNKSIIVFDSKNKEILSYNDNDADEVHISADILRNARKQSPVFFTYKSRDAVALADNENIVPTVIVVAAYDNDRVAWLSNLRFLLITGFLASLLIFIIAGFWFSSRVVRSISKLTEKLTQISSEAFSARLETGTEKDELQELATTINNLLDQLQSSFDTQRRFISNASHELTTPLAAISSQLDVALQKERTNEEYKKVFISIKDDVKRLVLLLRSILEIAKASGSVGGIDLTKVRIDELLMRIPVEMKKISQLYDVKLNFEDFPENEGYYILYGNEALLYSALRNVIHNACKFSKDKCAKVSLTYTYQNIVVEVKDNGPGISPEELQNLFQPFFRGHKYENTQMIHGTGLGLALAHRIIELHKGDIYVESKVGEGSTFSIFLPVDSTKTYKK
ncbi:MAG: HAMP domain-containing histidine kinase [Bacteroidetes bacterium]|nr:HAMP domain-containing histidine kinase [Bacteroidota bacterium]